ncbi:MAG: PCMD domain-containing protein [Bacteroidetes bacterium]|nr:PCMD domain-containing protein [Bacteroidota bacterium]
MMKRFLQLTVVAVLALHSWTSSAQVVNNSFENWATDTIHFAGIAPYLPAETFSYNDPSEWTTSNSITGMSALGGHLFVTQSSDAYHGSSAIKIITDTIARVFSSQLTVPGFAINGYFTVELSSLIGGLNITPMSIAGAGQPFTQRLTSLKGYYKYAPILNPNTSANDTCMIWATLRKGTTAVADAIYKSTISTNGQYAAFDIPFEYHNCEQPDTLVILLSSSIPKTAGLLSGVSDLVRGSELIVDSIYYDVIGSGYQFTPLARNDRDTTIKNTAKTINVLANDEDCDDPSLTVTILANAKNGTATVQANQILYTPAANFVGYDTIYYQASDGTNNAAAYVWINVKAPVGISEANQVAVKLFPNPVNQYLNIQLESKPGMQAEIFDALGKSIGVYSLDQNNTRVSTAGFFTGMYLFQITNASNQIISRGRFAVNR